MKTKNLCLTALGVALYVCLSMAIKTPLVAHIGIDFGYIVLAVYCYHFGWLSGMAVGGIGCAIVSMITSGWFSPGWFLGNLLIGGVCGLVFAKGKRLRNMAICIVMVTVGVMLIKSVVECAMFSIPLGVKLLNNGIAAATDCIVMCVGVLIAEELPFNRRNS